MSSRAQVLANNTTSFPNNNSGQITPQVLRDFNSDFVNSVRFSDEPVVQATSASFATTAADARLLDGKDSAEFISASTFTDYSSSMSTRITNQENFSSSLDATFATDAQLTSLSASVASTYVANAQTSSMTVLSSSFAVTASFALNGGGGGSVDTGSLLITASFNNGTRDLTFTKGDLTTFAVNIPGGGSVDTGSFVTTSSFNSFSSSISNRVTSLEQFSSSLDATFATDAELNAATASLSASIAILSGSYLASSASFSTRITAQEAFSSSLDATFATDAELNAYTSSNNARVQALENATASYVTNSQTGSFARTNVNNTFTGTQAFDNITVSGTASIQNLVTVSGSAVIIGDEFIILNANPPVARYAGIQIYDTGSASTASFEWDGVNDNWIIVEETGLSAGILTGPTGSKGSEVFPTNNTILKGSGHHTVGNSNITDDGSVVKINSNTEITGSLGVTGTITGTVTNAVTASFALLAATASFYGGSVVSASYARSASRADNSVLLNNFSSSQFALKTSTNTFTAANTFTSTANFNASNPLQGTNGILQFGFYKTDTLFFVSASSREAGFTNNLEKIGAANASTNTAGIYVSNAALSYFTAIEFPNGANYDGTVRIKLPTQITGSLNVTGGITGSLQGTSSFATNAATASFALNVVTTDTGSLLTTASAADNVITFTKGDASTFNVTVATGSAINTGSFLVNASISDATITFTKGDASTFAITANNVVNANTASYVLNAVSASFATSAASATNATSASFATTAQSVVSASFATNATSASFATTAQSLAGSVTSAATASYVNDLNQTLIITGSVRGAVNALTITSNTASMDLSLSNFFTLTIVSGSNTNINPTSINPGQTVNLRITQANPGNGTVSFPSSVKQVTGSAYVPSAGAGPVDILTFVSFDGSSLYLANVKNLV